MYTISFRHIRKNIAIFFYGDTEHHESQDFIPASAEITPKSNENIVNSFHEFISNPKYIAALEERISQIENKAESNMLYATFKDILSYDDHIDAIHTSAK